jgi:hypothetical protein
MNNAPQDTSASRQVDDIIKDVGDWRAESLAHLRAFRGKGVNPSPAIRDGSTA